MTRENIKDLTEKYKNYEATKVKIIKTLGEQCKYIKDLNELQEKIINGTKKTIKGTKPITHVIRPKISYKLEDHFSPKSAYLIGEVQNRLRSAELSSPTSNDLKLNLAKGIKKHKKTKDKKTKRQKDKRQKDKRQKTKDKKTKRQKDKKTKDKKNIMYSL